MDLQSRIQRLFRESIVLPEALPAGVRIPKRDEEDAIPQSMKAPSVLVSPGSKTTRQINDVDPLFKNIDTNMMRLQQGVADVKRALKDVDSKSGTNNLEKFNVDYDKLKSEIDSAKKEWTAKDVSSIGKDEMAEIFKKIKALSTKVAISFGNNFYRIKKAVPNQLNGVVWTFGEEPIKTIDKAVQPPVAPAPVVAPKPVAPVVAPKPVAAPKDDAAAWLAQHKDEIGDDEFANDTKPRHQEDDEDSPLRETIRNYFNK